MDKNRGEKSVHRAFVGWLRVHGQDLGEGARRPSALLAYASDAFLICVCWLTEGSAKLKHIRH